MDGSEITTVQYRRFQQGNKSIIKILQNKWAATEEVAACFMENTQKAYSEFDGDI